MAMRAVLRAFRVGESAAGGTDGELLRRFADGGDQAAFAAVFDRHAGMVLGVCRRALADPRDAEDACQATFLVLARKARAGRWRASVANWLHATARKVARNARVAAERRAKREAAAAVPEAVPAVDRMTARELLEALDEELARLPARYREPLVLCYLEGLTRDEAARRLGLRPGTVKIRLERGRRRLADALTARGSAPGAVLLAAAAASGSAAAPHLSEATLTAVGGRPTASVAALADGITTGPRFGVAGLALGAVMVGVGLLFGAAGGENPPPGAPNPAAAPAAAATDAFGDPLPPGAVARFGSVRFRNGMWTFHALPSPDGSRLATIGAGGPEHDEFLTVWDPDGRPVRTVPLAGALVEFVRWMPDGRGFALLKLDTAAYAVWEFTDEKAAPPAVIDRNNNRRYSVGSFAVATVSPDGKLAAGASRTADRATPDRLEVWAFTPGAQLRGAPPRLTIDTPIGFAWLGFTPDSKRLVGVTRGSEPDRPAPVGHGSVPGAKADVGKAYVWEVAGGKELLTFDVPGALRKGYAISPDGATLYAAGEKGRLAALDLATGKERFAVDVAQLPKDKPWLYLSELAVTPDGRTLLVVENMAAVAAIDAATGKPQWRSTDYEAKQVYSIAGLPGGKRFVIGGVDGGIVFGDVATGKVTPMPGYHRWFDAVAVDDSGRTAVTAGRDGNFRRWDVATGRELGKVALTDSDSLSALAFSPDRRLVVGAVWETNTKSVVVLADTTTGRTVARPKGDAGHLWTATFRGGRPAAWLSDGSVLLADADCAVRFGPDGKEVRTYTSAEIKAGSDAYSVAVSADGRRVALAGRGPRGSHPVPGWVAVFDVDTGKLIRAAQTRYELIGAAFTPDGSVVVTGGVYPPHPLAERSPEVSTAAAVGLFDPATGAVRYPFSDPTDGSRYRGPANLTMSPAGYQFAVAERDASITVYERASGAVRRRLRGHRNEIYQFAFTPDGSRLVSVSWDGTGLVWDVGPPKPAAPPAATDADQLKRWEALRSPDGAAAHRAMGELAADPAGAVALLKANLKPTPAPADAEIDKLIAGLGAEAFAERAAAGRDLDRLGVQAVPRVKARLAGVESAEVRRRLGEFLTAHDRRDRLTGSRLGERRAVELLEAVGTADARALLDELARAGSTPLAQDAAAAAARLRAK
jgi:RNA polymerase sigma factor (sigma-70 family)